MYRSLRRADHPSRAVLPSVVFLSDREASIKSRPLPTRAVAPWGKNYACSQFGSTEIDKIIIIIIGSCFYL